MRDTKKDMCGSRFEGLTEFHGKEIPAGVATTGEVEELRLRWYVALAVPRQFRGKRNGRNEL